MSLIIKSKSDTIPGDISLTTTSSSGYTTYPPLTSSSGSSGYSTYPTPTSLLGPISLNDMIELINKTKLEVLEEIADDLEECKTTAEIVTYINKIRRKVEKIKNKKDE